MHFSNIREVSQSPSSPGFTPLVCISEDLSLVCSLHTEGANRVSGIIVQKLDKRFSAKGFNLNLVPEIPRASIGFRLPNRSVRPSKNHSFIFRTVYFNCPDIQKKWHVIMRLVLG
jgi:hypothetical protein